MIIKRFICDRCEKEITENPFKFSIGVLSADSETVDCTLDSDLRKMDYCKECAEELSAMLMIKVPKEKLKAPKKEVESEPRTHRKGKLDLDQMLAFILAGRDRKWIADEMGTTEGTVSYYKCQFKRQGKLAQRGERRDGTLY